MGCKYNEDYFKDINANSAYIMGFILADGCIYCPGYEDSKYKGLTYRIKIAIHQKDAEIVEFIKTQIVPDKKLYYKTDITKNNYIRHQIDLCLDNKKLVQSIMSYGITPNKTGKETFPIIPEEFYPDLIRGYFDGDGSVYIAGIRVNKYKKNTLMAGVSFSSGGIDILNNLKLKLNNIGANVHLVKKDNSYEYKITKKTDIVDIYNYMYYSDAVFCLKRKKDIFNTIIEEYTNG